MKSKLQSIAFFVGEFGLMAYHLTRLLIIALIGLFVLVGFFKIVL